jgi:hypothetical protein
MDYQNSRIASIDLKIIDLIFENGGICDVSLDGSELKFDNI